MNPIKMNRCGWAAFAAVSLGMISARSTAQTRLSVINLGPSDPTITATAVNDDYQVTGNYVDNSFVQHGFFWQPGLVAENITNAVELNAINNLGMLAGAISSSGADADIWYPSTPYSGTFTAVAPFVTTPSSFNGAGDDQVFCGWDGSGGVPFWDTLDPTRTAQGYDYGSAAGTALGIVQGLDDMVGYSDSGATRAAAMWQYGASSVPAQLLAVVSGFGNPSAVTASDEGLDMVGYATSTAFPTPLQPMAFTYTGAASTALALLPRTITGEALAINGAAILIGGYCNTEATVWFPSGGNYGYNNPVDLNSLTGPTSQWHLQTVTGINDYGAFVGAGLFGQKHVAYLAIPVTLSGLTLSSNQVVGATSVIGTVTIGSPAPFDMTVSLSSFLANATFTNGSHSSSVVIAQGTTDADFQLNVANPSIRSQAYIRANYGGWDVYSKLVSVP